MTPGCTKESCHFRDLEAEFAAVGATRLGISADPIDRQRQFSEKHGFDFPLLSDPERVVARMYGVRRLGPLFNRRSTFVIGALLLLGGNGGVVLAELRIPSGLAAVLVATVPIWLAVFESILTRRPPSLLAVGGLVAGIACVLVLLVPADNLEDIDPIGVILVVAGTMCSAK